MSAIAKLGDRVVGLDQHYVLLPTPGGPTPVLLPCPFQGQIDSGTIAEVLVDHAPIAVVGSQASCSPAHIPYGGPFMKPPAQRGTIAVGSSTVLVGHRAVARDGDEAMCCNDPCDALTSHVIAKGSVSAG